MLEEFSEQLGNNGCNDWEWPDYLTDDDIEELKDTDREVKECCHERYCPDFIAVFAVKKYVENNIH